MASAEPADEPAATLVDVEVERRQIAAALAGDGLAFRRLVEPHLAMLYRIAARSSGGRHLAEDAVQETLTLAFRRLRVYVPATSFKAFLAAIAVRRAHTLARSERRRRRREELGDAPGPLATPEQAFDGAVAAQRIRNVLATMPEKRRSAAMLRLDAGLSYREIAQSLGTSEGSARVLVHMACRQLREQLSDLLFQSE